jgi:hypothetical protein
MRESSSNRSCVLVRTRLTAGETNVHITAKNHVWTGRIGCRSVSEQFERELGVVDDDERLAQYCQRADRAIEFPMLCPVVAFKHTRLRQIIDIAEKG